MRLALDVNRYVDFGRGDAAVLAAIQRADELFMPFVVLAELRSGFLGGRYGVENERRLDEFLSEPRVHLLFADDITTRVYASLVVELRRVGTPIPTNDLWIAALVVQHDLTLFTRDKHFSVVPRVHVL